jgi:hypothetical protein
VRDEEVRRGYPKHLFGSLSENDAIDQQVDFASFHKDQPLVARAYPIQVNEFFPQAQARYLSNLQIARASGTVYHYWHDDNPSGGPWDVPTWEAEWTDTMAKMGKPAPPLPCTFPCPTGAECTVIEVCRPCTPPIPGNPLWDGDFGKATEQVLTANPTRFQGRHLIGGAANAQWLYQAIVAQLMAKGICAVAREDAVELSEDSIHDEEMHVLAFGSGDVAGPANQYGFKSRSRRP